MRTSPQKTSTNASPANDRLDRGFTLVEMIVVIALIALIGAMALPNISNITRINTSSAVRNIATTLKETYNSTMVRARVYRMAFDLDANQYWVEEGPAEILLDSEDSRKRDEKRSFGFLGVAKKKQGNFRLDETVTRKKLSLPSGIKFQDVMNEQSADPVKSGIAYTHFFPHGVAERTVIHLLDAKDHSTSLIVSSLMGRSILKDGYVNEEEAFGKRK